MEDQTENYILFESIGNEMGQPNWATFAFWDHPATYVLFTMIVMKFMGF